MIDQDFQLNKTKLELGSAEIEITIELLEKRKDIFPEHNIKTTTQVLKALYIAEEIGL